MVGEVVAGEGVDPIGVAGDVGDGDRDDLAVARCRARPRRPGASRSAGAGANSAAATMVVTSSLVWARSTISAMAASPPTASWWITFSGSAGMGAAWAEPLTRG